MNTFDRKEQIGCFVKIDTTVWAGSLMNVIAVFDIKKVCNLVIIINNIIIFIFIFILINNFYRNSSSAKHSMWGLAPSVVWLEKKSMCGLLLANQFSGLILVYDYYSTTHLDNILIINLIINRPERLRRHLMATQKWFIAWWK